MPGDDKRKSRDSGGERFVGIGCAEGGVTMQDYQELVPDAELFARVWKRVMPDESMSPIEVHRPEGHVPKEKGPAVPPKPGRDDRAWLREVLEEMEAGLARGGDILRRDPGAWPLEENMRKSAAQLRAAWLLLTGERWRGRPAPRPHRGSMEDLLREQYLWELRFSGLCRQAGEGMKRSDAAEIMPEQERESMKRRRMLRHMLARGT